MNGIKVTREMVAQRAGVCKQTVSCYLNKTRGVSKESADKIEAAIGELNYVPNMVARGLSQKKTMSLAIICDDLGNPNYSEIISGVERAAKAKNYSVLIFDIAMDGDSVAKQIIARRVDGVILLTFKEKLGEKNICDLDNHDVKLVITHSAGEISDKYMQLEPDYTSGMEETLLALRERGHKDIVMLSCFGLEDKYDRRLKIFADCYQKIFGRSAKYLIDDANGGASLETGRRLAERLCNENLAASAILTTNDLMAIGAVKYFNQTGLIDRISVVGFDDMAFNEYISPSLSSIGYDKIEYGKKLVELFLASSGGAEARTEYVKTKLFMRESIRRVK